MRDDAPRIVARGADEEDARLREKIMLSVLLTELLIQTGHVATQEIPIALFGHP
jgi:hypothetical protein